MNVVLNTAIISFVVVSVQTLPSPRDGTRAGNNDTTTTNYWFRRFNYNEIYKHTDDYRPLFENEKYIHFTMNCLLDRAPCKDYQTHREWFPFIAKSECAFCNPIQKARFNSTKHFLIKNYPQYYEALVQKYSKDDY